MQRYGANALPARKSRWSRLAATAPISSKAIWAQKKAFHFWVGHMGKTCNEVQLLSAYSVPAARPESGGRASFRLGGFAQQLLRSEERRRRIRFLSRPAQLCREARFRCHRRQRASSDRLRHDAGTEPDRQR